jgi:hypothetical protein
MTHLKPRIPSRADAGQKRDFLATQTGGPSAPQSRQSNAFRGKGFAAGAQEIGHFSTPQARGVKTSQVSTHVTIVSHEVKTALPPQPDLSVNYWFYVIQIPIGGIANNLEIAKPRALG